MKLTSALLTFVFALSLIAGGTAIAASGKIESVADEGRSFTLGGKEYKVSNSRTKITIKGEEAKRGQLKAGMTCDVQGDGEASMVSCK